MVTATDPDAISKLVRKHMEVIEFPAYSEQEELAIAEH